MENENSLQGVLSYFYQNLKSVEKTLLFVFLADMAGYIILFITFLMLTGQFLLNSLLISLIFFPMISGITMVSIFYL